MARTKKLEIALLVKFDPLLLSGVETERTNSPSGTRPDGRPKLVPRTAMIRTLVREGLDARAVRRGEEIPKVESAA